jgi:general secretion pathway protein G
MKKQSGFTLVEILIVVVILGILAAIVIPQFTEASTEARTNSLCADLQTVRSQIELYKIQHNDNFPGPGDVTFEESMTKYTDISGDDTVTQTPGSGRFGPYLQKMPENPFNTLATVAEVNGVDGLGNDSHGWHFDKDTGQFYADSDGHTGY